MPSNPSGAARPAARAQTLFGTALRPGAYDRPAGGRALRSRLKTLVTAADVSDWDRWEQVAELLYLDDFDDAGNLIVKGGA